MSSLLSLPLSSSLALYLSAVEVTVEELKSLEFLLMAFDKKDIVPLSVIAQYSSETKSNGFVRVCKSLPCMLGCIFLTSTVSLQATQTFPLTGLEQWLRSRLQVNPYGPQAMKAGSRDRKCPCFKSESTGRIVTNSRVAPKGSV